MIVSDPSVSLLSAAAERKHRVLSVRQMLLSPLLKQHLLTFENTVDLEHMFVGTSVQISLFRVLNSCS